MIRFHNPTAELFIPDGIGGPEALARITHLGIGAHQDDLEFMAFHGILACFDDAGQWFAGVTCTDGTGSARSGSFAQCTDDEMRGIRRNEQNAAARIGRYGAMIQLDYPSSAIRDPRRAALRGDLTAILAATRPQIVYTHNLADKHATHVGVAVAAIEAMRALPPGDRPNEVYGCEVWRDLDWMPDSEKIILDVGGNDELAASLCGVFRSQIAGGKRYDSGVAGRRRANATFQESHAVDRLEAAAFAMDLTPLVLDESLSIPEYVDGFIERFRNEVATKLRAGAGSPQ